jgi:hypothetical protein
MDRDDKKQQAYETATVREIVEDVAEQAWDLLSGRMRRVGFASDRRCILEDAGTLLAATLIMKEQSDEIERLREECARRASEADRARKEYEKLYRKQFDKVPAPPAAEKKPTRTELAAKARALGVPGPTSHREHKWDTGKTPPVCEVCGKVKSNRGRKSHANPAANVTVATVDGVTKVDPPSLPLPAAAPAKSKGRSVELASGETVDLADADDEFAAGTVGGRG